MSKTRSALEAIDSNLNESVGLREAAPSATLSPVPSAKDTGRQPLRTFGKVDVSRVEPDPSQPRKEFSDESIQRLAQSIKEKGQLQPITVRWSPESKKWFIISGERRWGDSKVAWLKTMRCEVDHRGLSSCEPLEEQRVEFLLREDLKPIEQARAYSSLMKLNGWNGKQVAESLHIAPSTVSRALTLLDLPEEVRQKVDDGELSARAAYEISKLPTPSGQRRVASQTNVSAEKVKATVSQRQGKTKQAKQGFKQTFIAESGIKVQVRSASKTNYHEVELALKEAIDEVKHYIANNRIAL